MSQINVGGVVFTIDAILSGLDRTLASGRQKVDDFRRYAERPMQMGGPNFGGGSGGGGGGGSRGTSGNVTHGQWDLEGGSTTMSQRYGYMGTRATASYRQSDMHAELVASRTRGSLAAQQGIMDDARADYEGRTNAGEMGRVSNLIANRDMERATNARLAQQQSMYDDMQRIQAAAQREVRTRPGGVRGSRRYYSAGGDDYAGEGYGRGGRPAESRDATLEMMAGNAAGNIATPQGPASGDGEMATVSNMIHNREAERITNDRLRVQQQAYDAAVRRSQIEVDRGGARSMLSTGVVTGEMPYGATSRISRFTGRPLGDTEVEVNPYASNRRMGNFTTQDSGGLRSDINTGEISGDPAAHTRGSQNPLFRPVQVRNLLRYTLAGIIADTFALELGNEQNYKKGMVLAGMDQHAQATATLGRFKGGLRAIPVLGQALESAFSPFTTPIELDLEATQRRESIQSTQHDMRMGAIMRSREAGEIRYGKNTYGRRSAITEREIAEAREARRQANSKAIDEFNKTVVPWDKSPNNPYNSILSGYGMMIPPELRPKYEQMGKDYNDDLNRKREQAMAAATAGMKSEEDLANAKRRQDMLNLQEDYTIASGATQEKILAANKRPVAGALANLSANASASYNRYMADTKSGAGMAFELNSQMGNLASAQQIFQDARDRQLFGQTISFNPFNESADKFQTKDTESLDQKMQTALDTMARIAQYIMQIQQGGIR